MNLKKGRRWQRQWQARTAKTSRRGRGRRGLRKLPPELIAQAHGQTAATITRIMLTFVGVAIFCLLSLLTPDAALLTGGERLNVPFAGPVSFRGFIIIGPALLILLRIYLQIYVEHWRRLDPIRGRLPTPRMPTMAPMQNPLLWIFVAFVLYLLLPLTMLAFTWKAAVLPAWGSGLLGVTVAVIAWHLALPFRWRRLLVSFLTSFGAAFFFVAAATTSDWPLSRPPDLFRANLSSQYLAAANLRGANLQGANLRDAWLYSADLRGAHLENANLRGGNLQRANLRDAFLYSADLGLVDLWGANLGGAVLWRANLGGASLEEANLEGAELGGANLEEVNLRGANIKGADLAVARNLVQSRLDLACGDATTKLPPGLKVGTCWWHEETQ